MGMVVQHNMSAMNANRQLGISSSNLSKSTEKLSSGYKINRAGDDAAGLAISEKMRGQIRGLDQASSNAEDGISLVQTAEGALQESQNIIQRMRELAVQAASDTNTDDDREQIQNEITQLTQEVDRIANTTEFNTKKLLDGSVSGSSSYNSGKASAEGTFTNGVVSVALQGSDTLSADTKKLYGDGTKWYTDETLKDEYTGTETVVGEDGKTVTNVASAGGYIHTTTDKDIASTISSLNNTSENVSVTYNEKKDEITITVKNAAYKENEDVLKTATTSGTTDLNFVISNASKIKAGDVVTLNLQEAKLTESAATGEDALRLQVGANGGQEIELSISSMKAADLGITQTGENNGEALDVTSQSKASMAIEAYDNALQKVSNERSKLGAKQNRLEHTITNLDTSSENLQSAESRIRDVDMASEMTTYSKYNILQQAGQSMLAQANQSTQGVLSLLG